MLSNSRAKRPVERELHGEATTNLEDGCRLQEEKIANKECEIMGIEGEDRWTEDRTIPW